MYIRIRGNRTHCVRTVYCQERKRGFDSVILSVKNSDVVRNRNPDSVDFTDVELNKWQDYVDDQIRKNLDQDAKYYLMGVTRFVNNAVKSIEKGADISSFGENEKNVKELFESLEILKKQLRKNKIYAPKKIKKSDKKNENPQQIHIED